MEDFYAVAQQVHKERVTARHYDYTAKKLNGEYIYSNFSMWCYLNEKNDKSDLDFAKYLELEDIKLTFHQRKYLAEKYFGWEFTYNYETEKWETRRVR